VETILQAGAPYDDPVALTEQRLSSRRTRECDHARENAALLALADEMATRPDNVLNLLCELILDACGADSAGVSLLNDASDEFVWPAVAGAWAPFVNGVMPRSASPCGLVIEHDQALIVRDVVERFPAAAQASPEIGEILLAPFHQGGVPIGTVWAISHDPDHEFDREDRRVLTNLSRFAAAAHQMRSAEDSASSAESRLAIANRELGHRLKNLLTMVMAITSQTLRGDKTRAESDVLQHRLEALGAAHKVLIQQQSPEASISAIAANVLGTIGQLDRVAIDGPEVSLGPRTALACSLVLHELGTNALKYGALSREGGRVRLSWAVDEDGAEPTLSLRWQEAGGPTVTTPKRLSFGTRLIRMGLLGSGETLIDYDPDGVQVQLSAPLKDATTV
jgi:two-component sensor histidine kinase/putative methionine-R-sulfoxide reductase with GAF domain